MTRAPNIAPDRIEEKKPQLTDIVQGLAAGAKTSPQPVSKPPVAENLHVSEIEARLLRILQNDALISGGRVQAVGLQQIKHRLGRKWPAKRDLVHRTMKSIIQRKISKQDVYFRRSDEEYLIVFATLGLEPAKFICAGIIKELNERFLGSSDTRDVVVKTAVGAAEGRLMFKEARLDKLLENFKEMSDEDVDEVLTDESLKKQVKAASWEYMGKDPEAEQVPADFEIVYSPVWDVKREILTTYIASYIGYNTTGAVRNGYTLVSNPRTIAAMDRSLLDDAVATMEDLFRNNFRIMICIPLHYETVHTEAHLWRLVERLREIPEFLRAYLLLACDNFPPGVPVSKLSVITSALRPHCKNLAVNAEIDRRDFGVLKEAGVTVVGCNMPRGPTSAAEIGPRIVAFANAAKRAGLTPSFLGVRDLEVAEFIRHSGAQHIMGRVIGDYDFVPGHMVRLPWKDIVARAHTERQSLAALDRE